MQFKTVFFALLAAALTEAAELEKRACPNIHVFGARETTVSPGYGTAGVVVNLVLNAYPGSTAEAINYPACGGQSSCGGVSYANSVQQGTAAVASQVNSFYQQCPQTQLVLVGYSQGGQIFDNAFCGGGDSSMGISSSAIPISSGALNQIKAVIMMGNPRRAPGLSYNVGTCNGSGFDPRPSGFQCPSGSKVQSYCDSPDQYCCSGSDTSGATHQGYGNKYGQAALTFIKSKLSTGGNSSVGGSSSTNGGNPTTTSNNNGGGNCSAKWGQCGGQGWTGPTCCQSGSTCKASNQWYSQCL